MNYNMGFVPTMYVTQTICDNREKRQNSAKRNYQRMVYEFTENNNIESFEEMLNTEIGVLKNKNYERNLA